jgi:hypothetical protein
VSITVVQWTVGDEEGPAPWMTPAGPAGLPESGWSARLRLGVRGRSDPAGRASEREEDGSAGGPGGISGAAGSHQAGCRRLALEQCG